MVICFIGKVKDVHFIPFYNNKNPQLRVIDFWVIY